MQTYGSSSSTVEIRFASIPSPVIVSRLSPVMALIYTPAIIPYLITCGTSSFIYGLSPIRPTKISSQSSKVSLARNLSKSNFLTFLGGSTFFFE